MAKWWEKEPVRFQCQEGCFKCCMKPGAVYFDREDIENAAAFLETSVPSFKSKYRLKGRSPIWELEVEEESPCPFLTMQGCSIHSAKPKQCRTYPFWKEHLSSKNYWELTAGFCPGIHEGPPVPADEIKKCLKSYRL